MSNLTTTHPHLAAQLVDPTLGRSLTAGSGRKVSWRCDHGHVWTAAVYSRAKGTGCPYCAGKAVLPGFNDLATTHPKLAARLVDIDEARTVNIGTHRKLRWRCLSDPRHVWEAKPSNLLLGRDCAVCSGRRVQPGVNDLASTHPDLARQLVDPEDGARLTAGSSKSPLWQCDTVPEHRWRTSVAARVRGHGCPICSGHRVVPSLNDLATTHPELARELADPEDAHRISAGSVRRVSWRCPADERHVWSASASNRIAGSGCPFCANQAVLPGVNDLATTHPELARELVDPAEATRVTAGSKRVLLWRCRTNPDHTWSSACYHRSGPVPTGCPHCFGPAPSQAERRLADAVTTLVGDAVVLRSHRGLFDSNHEVDIFLPEHRLAIEFNGLYWHSLEAGRTVVCHRDKLLAAQRAGVRLVQVWEDDWRDRPEAVLRMLAHRLHATDRLPLVLPGIDPTTHERVHARSLSCDAVSLREAAAFLERNHIQGSTPLSHAFALHRDGVIRALLGLRSPKRNARMNRSAGEWEIQRYATCGIIPGGFTRLLRYAERVLRAEGVELTRWVSFSADDISDGGLYRAAGFTADRALPPDYRYAGNLTGWRRVPKERFQRRRFRDDPTLVWDESWTEREAAVANGLVRVYDAGKTRWVRDVA